MYSDQNPDAYVVMSRRDTFNFPLSMPTIYGLNMLTKEVMLVHNVVTNLNT